MKTFWLILLAVALGSGFIARADAQSYAIDWHKIAGGGGTSTGSVYSVTGTIGQPDAGSTMSGGNYAVTGGFWSYVAAVQTPGAPFLNVGLTSTNTVSVSWLFPSTGFVLQMNSDLNTTNWTSVPDAPIDGGGTRTVVVNPPAGNRFYRLIHP